MKNESIYRMTVVILLAGILTVQLVGLLKMPQPKDGISKVSVIGNVDVNVKNSIEVHTKPFIPLEITQ
jgi:hypothetical protein